MARDDDTVTWFDERELDGGTTVVGAQPEEPSDEEIDREFDEMFASVVKSGASEVAGAGFRAAVHDRMPGAPSEGRENEDFPRIALDAARQMYVIPVADPVRFLAAARRHYHLMAASEDRPPEVMQLMATEFFKAGLISELTEGSALSLFLGAAAQRWTPEQAATVALNQDLAAAFQARAAETFKGDKV